ncbi:unnamed protein product [Hyaloperonospora brassicae]|uniref:RxLR effector protein n=1 Tax=Hyaloperonospora brassicae TaxID=162125 RepID=A0AAV0T2K8_HYABA|nr:unnamed protein product [Hyaloperonospora brassicae]CAI5713427.1 unnamed protein product [Hyaloperonospora brassicae]
MRFVYSAAAALVAVFASSDAASTGADANALLESDVSLVARVTDGNAYDVDTQRLLREALDDDESMLPADFEERAPGGAVVEEAAPKLEKALSGVLHAGEVGGGANARLAETAIANSQQIEEIQRGAVAKVQHVEETQGGVAAQGQHVEEIQGGAVAKGQHVEETHGGVAAKGQHVEETQATTKLSWTKRQWEKFVNLLNKSKLFRDFMAWIKSHKAKVKPVGEGNTADATDGKKLEDAVEDAGTVGTAGATRAVDPNGAANAGVHPTGAHSETIPNGAANAGGRPTAEQPKPPVSPEELPVRAEPKPQPSVENPSVVAENKPTANAASERVVPKDDA